MKDAKRLFILIKRRLLRIYSQKMVLPTYTQEIYKSLPLKCLKYIRTCRQGQVLFCVRQTHYKLKNPNHFAIPNVNSVYHVSESISNLGHRIWNLIPDRLKELNNISSFKNKIKRWQPEICPCRFCKTYIPRVGFFVIPYK